MYAYFVQAHFGETCFYIGKNGNTSRSKDAVPSIEVFLLDPDCGVDNFKSRPLYSSSDLQNQDQNYVEHQELSSDEVKLDHLKHLVSYKRDLKLIMAHKLTETDVDFENLKTTKVDQMKFTNSTKYCNHFVAAALHILSEDAHRSDLKTPAVFLQDLARLLDLMSLRTNEDALKLSDCAGDGETDIRNQGSH